MYPVDLAGIKGLSQGRRSGIERNVLVLGMTSLLTDVSSELVGERIVKDALNPEQALAELLDEGGGKGSTLLGAGFTEMGIGLAFERTPEGFQTVWVQCLARPASKLTGADVRQESQEGLGAETERSNPRDKERGGSSPP